LTLQTAVDGNAQSAYSPARALRPTSCRMPFPVWRALQRGWGSTPTRTAPLPVWRALRTWAPVA